MKIICEKSHLLNGVQIVSRAVPNKTTMSILECILIDATKDKLTLTANDMELGIETKVEAKIEESGIIALDAKILLEIVRKLPDSEVTITTDDSLMTKITCEKAVFTYLPEIERFDSVLLSQITLRDIIRQTIFSIADNDNNKIMTGELFEINGNILKVVSLDGHRVSVRKVELKNTYPEKKAIVPGKTLNEISKILSGDADKDIHLFFTGKHIIFEFEETVVVSRLIDGEYFKIDQMLTTDYETKVKINKREFLDCIDRATLLVKEGDKKPIILNIDDVSMKLRMNSTLGSMNDEIEITKQGKDIMIGFNPRFLIDALRVIDDDDIEVYLVNPKAPCFIKNAAETYNYMILPVNFVTID